VNVVTEVLSILLIAAKEAKRKRASEFFLQDILHARPFSYLIRNIFQETVGKESKDRY
jgi:hypothetical protein